MDQHSVHSSVVPRCLPQSSASMGVASVVIGMGLVLGACTRTASLDRPHCSNTVQTRVSASKPTVTVIYTEPSVNQAGDPLKELAKTSVYYDFGSGRTLAKEVPSTKPTGGGQISETITLPVKDSKESVVHICVTATDRQGHESLATP